MAKQGRSKVKRYGVIFTSLVIRAVHIEVAHCLHTESFLNALRILISRRGKPKDVRSVENLSMLSELNLSIWQWNQSRIYEFLLQQEIDWIFNPPLASHMGGVSERKIRSIRKVMNAQVKEQLLNDEGLNTLMCEIDSILNSRPLTKVSDDQRDASALSPNHLLLLKANHCYPPGLIVF